MAGAAGAAGAMSAARSAQPEPNRPAHRPASAGRYVHVFDFEERAQNPDPVPRGWFRAQDNPPERPRPGFPAWNAAVFDDTVRRSGQTSVRVGVNGGSGSLRLAPGVVQVLPGAQYLMTAAVRTSAAARAGAVVSARFMDNAGQTIGGTQVRTEPVRSEGDWTLVWLRLPVAPRGAASLQIDLELLQPGALSQDRQQSALERQDLAATAWFDDVAVFQLPQIELRMDGPVPVVSGAGPAPARFELDVSDQTGEALTARFTLTDTDGREVSRESIALAMGGGRVEWRPRLPARGWYRVSAEVSGPTARVGSATRSFLWTDGAGDGPGLEPSRPRMGVILADPEADPVPVGSMVRSLGIQGLTVPIALESPESVLPAGPEGQALAARELAAVRARRQAVEALATTSLDLTLSLDRLPEPLWQEYRLDPNDPAALGDQPPELWRPQLQRWLDLMGQRVSRWRIGPSARSTAQWLTGSSASVRPAGVLRTVVEASVPAARVTVPWIATYGRLPARPARGGGLEGVEVLIPASFPPRAIEAELSRWLEWSRGRGATLDVIIGLPDEEGFGRAATVVEAAQRAALVWREVGRAQLAEPGHAGASVRTLLDHPFVRVDASGAEVAGAGAASDRLEPRAVLGAWATLSQHLADRPYLGEIIGEGGARCLIFGPSQAGPGSLGDSPSAGGLAPSETGGVGGAGGSDGEPEPGGDGMLLAWAQGLPAESGGVALEGYFAPPGGRLVQVDLFGNRTQLEPIDPTRRYRVPLSPEPVIILGADAALTRFTSGLTIDPSFVPSVAAQHEAALVLTNPWPRRIFGSVQLPSNQGPASRPWQFSPSTPLQFSIAPGQSQRLPFAFSFSASEEAGHRDLRTIVKLQTDRAFEPMQIDVPLTIGLRDLDIQLSSTVTPEGDVVVLATLTNSGAGPRTLTVDLVAANQPRQVQQASNLQPGEAIVRRFVYRGQAGAMIGKRVRATLNDIEGLERLNKTIKIQ
ncbi:MAG: hypothetical protein C0475_06845 [Planctomyces sp.]|nr:hypothetical protein [Planctomyces sp.]